MAPRSPTRTCDSCRWWPRSRHRRCATRTATSAWRSASRRRGRRCGAWSSSAWRCCRSCAACSAHSASARAPGPKGCCRAPRPTSSTGWWASRWPSFKRKPKVGEGSCRPSRRAAAAHRARQLRLLRTRQAGDVRRRVRPPVPRAAGARGQASRAAHPRQPHATRRRGARDGVQEAPPPRADAVARQRVQRGGARRMGKPQRPARPGGSHRRPYARSEDRRRRGESHVREGALRRRRDAWERPGRRRRHGRPADRGGCAAAAHGQGLAQADGGARRGLSLQVSLRGAQPGARAGGRAHLRQSAQRRRGIAAPARPQDHAQPRPADLLLPRRSARPEAARRHAARAARAAHRVGLPRRNAPRPRPRPRTRQHGDHQARDAPPHARLWRRRRRGEGQRAQAARRAGHGGESRAALGHRPQVRARGPDHQAQGDPDQCRTHRRTQPVCHSKVEYPSDEVMAYCSNVSCPGRILESIVHFAAVMDIRGLGYERVRALLDAKLIKEVADLYELMPAQLLKLEGFAEKSAQQLVDAIQASKRQPLSMLLYALGIRHVGAQGAKLLARRLGTLKALRNASVEEISKIRGVGMAIAEAVAGFFDETKNRKLLERLEKLGLNFTEPTVTEGKGPLAGQTYVVTGTLPSLSRTKAAELIEAAGGHVADSVSKKTTALVVGADAGSKFEKAKALGIPIIDEAELLRRARAKP